MPEPRYATWRKKTAGALCLRAIVNKILAVKFPCSHATFGEIYHGHEDRELTGREERLRGFIQNGAMPKARAKNILNKMDLSIPFKTRAEYIECLAALSASYPEDMSRKVTGANRCTSEILASSCMPQRLEFLWNNLRWRHDVRLALSVHVYHVTYDLTVLYLPATTGPSELVLLKAGTCSNEDLHAEIRNWFNQTQQTHQGTLQLKLRILTYAKQLPHHAALRYPTLSQVSSQDLLARLVGDKLWTGVDWDEWCGDSTEKADLPIERQREKRPAARQPVDVNLPRRRTVFTMAREHKLRRQGTVDSDVIRS